MTITPDSVVWITGASSGIGAALARRYASAGARVILSARRGDKLREVASSCAGGLERHRVVPMDLAEPTMLPEKAEHARACFGQIDVLVNNAGLSQRSRALETDLSVTRRIMEINFFAAVQLTQLVVPQMIERGGGRIVAISSVVGKFGAPGRSSYGASKHALHGYFDALRAELFAQHIGVTLVTPGYIQTDISLHAVEADGSEHGTLDPGQAGGMSAESCAEQIVRGVSKGCDEILVGGRETLGVYLKRFWPGLLNRILRTARVD